MRGSPKGYPLSSYDREAHGEKGEERGVSLEGREWRRRVLMRERQGNRPGLMRLYYFNLWSLLQCKQHESTGRHFNHIQVNGCPVPDFAIRLLIKCESIRSKQIHIPQHHIFSHQKYLIWLFVSNTFCTFQIVRLFILFPKWCASGISIMLPHQLICDGAYCTRL